MYLHHRSLPASVACSQFSVLRSLNIAVDQFRWGGSAANHPLAKHYSVSIATLAERPIVLLDLPISRKYFLNAFKMAGLTPDISEKTRDMDVMPLLVANGFGFSLANIKPHSDLSPDGQVLKFIPIEGSVKPLRLGCIVAEGSRNVLAIDTFIEEAAKIIASWDYPSLPV